MKQEYNKPITTIEEQIDKLEYRGLNIPDRNRAERYLSFIFYYRLSAYFPPFQLEKDRFNNDVFFDDILSTYIFDRELRLLVLDAIERIEIAVRSKICNIVCEETQDIFWIYDQQYFIPYRSGNKHQHGKILENIQRIIYVDRNYNNYSETTPLQHHANKYTNPHKPAVWMVFESLIFGDLSLIYRNLRSRQVRKRIAHELGVNQPLLDSWLANFQMIRNICAHHARLWNRGFGARPARPRNKIILWVSHEVPSDNQKLYISLIAIQTILFTISPFSTWARRLQMLLSKYPNIILSQMGFPERWEKDPFWVKALSRESL